MKNDLYQERLQSGAVTQVEVKSVNNKPPLPLTPRPIFSKQAIPPSPSPEAAVDILVDLDDEASDDEGCKFLLGMQYWISDHQVLSSIFMVTVPMPSSDNKKWWEDGKGERGQVLPLVAWTNIYWRLLTPFADIPRANTSFADKRNPFEANSLEESGLLLDSSDGMFWDLNIGDRYELYLLIILFAAALLDQASTFEDSWIPIQPTGSSWSADDEFSKQTTFKSEKRPSVNNLSDGKEAKTEQPSFNDSIAFWNGKQ